MVHWGWLIVAAILGGCFGAVIMALFAAHSIEEDAIDHFCEAQRLRDENWYLKRKLDGTE